MRVLSLDLSTCTGYAVLDKSSDNIFIHKFGNLEADDPGDKIKYPWSYINKANSIAMKCNAVMNKFNPDVVIIEETNGSKSRFTQKLLEFIHFAVLTNMPARYKSHIEYINTSDWRKKLSINLSLEDKKQNSKLSKAKSLAKKTGQKLNKKKLGIKGRVTKKHIALRYVNSITNLDLKVKDNDIAEAICMGIAYLQELK